MTKKEIELYASSVLTEFNIKSVVCCNVYAFIQLMDRFKHIKIKIIPINDLEEPEHYYLEETTNRINIYVRATLDINYIRLCIFYEFAKILLDKKYRDFKLTEKFYKLLGESLVLPKELLHYYYVIEHKNLDELSEIFSLSTDIIFERLTYLNLK